MDGPPVDLERSGIDTPRLATAPPLPHPPTRTPRTYLVVVAVTLGLVGGMGYSLWAGYQTAAVHAHLVDHMVEVKLQAALAHLWLEEVLAGDSAESFAKVEKHLGAALSHARSLTDSTVAGWVPNPRTESHLYTEIDTVIASLERVLALARLRYEMNGTGAGSAADQHFDASFALFFEQVDRLEEDFRLWIDQDLATYRRIQLGLIALGILLGFFVGGVIYRVDKERVREFDVARQAQRVAQANEKWLSTTLESMGDAVIITDAQGRVTYLNPVATALTGWSSSDAFGETCSEVFRITAEDPAVTIEDPVTTILRERRVVGLDNHTILIAKDGSRRAVADSGAPIWGDDGAILGIVLVFHDVSERKRLEAELRQAQKMEAIGTLASGVAHEMNNIFAVVLGLATVIQDELLVGSSGAEDLEMIMTAAKRGGALTSNLMTFARKRATHKERLSLNDTVASVTGILERTSYERVVIETDLGEDLAPTDCDANQMTQALMNLCLNAIDAMPDGGRLRIETSNRNIDASDRPTHPDLEPGPYVQMRVSDDGHGMDAATVERAFEPFFTTKEVGKGTGLGLSMVYGLVREHDGAVEIDSALGRGTTVTLVLPAAGPGPEVAPHKEVAAPKRGHGTLMLIDDEPALRDVGARILRKLGYEVLVAADGLSALDLFRREGSRVDLVLLDLAMPGMNGAACFEGLREIDPDIRVLICTGDPDAEVANRILVDGAVGILHKPYDIQTLSETIANATQAT